MYARQGSWDIKCQGLLYVTLITLQIPWSTKPLHQTYHIHVLIFPCLFVFLHYFFIVMFVCVFVCLFKIGFLCITEPWLSWTHCDLELAKICLPLTPECCTQGIYQHAWQKWSSLPCSFLFQKNNFIWILRHWGYDPIFDPIFDIYKNYDSHKLRFSQGYTAGAITMLCPLCRALPLVSYPERSQGSIYCVVLVWGTGKDRMRHCASW